MAEHAVGDCKGRPELAKKLPCGGWLAGDEKFEVAKYAIYLWHVLTQPQVKTSKGAITINDCSN